MNNYQFDYQGMLDELNLAKALWQQQHISSYIYQHSHSCFCNSCWTAPKYVVVDYNIVQHVEFDQANAPHWNNDCNECDLIYPLADNYHPIDWYYDEAIEFAKNGVNAGCPQDEDEAMSIDMIMRDPSVSNPEYCGGFITFTYDETLYFPLTISLFFGPMIADANRYFEFGCLTPFLTHVAAIIYTQDPQNTDLSNFNRQCHDYTGCTDSPCDLQLPKCLYKKTTMCHGKEFHTPCDAICEGYDIYHQCWSYPSELPCICTREYRPVCCDGTEWANSCLAECRGFNVADDCILQKCNDAIDDDCICIEIYEPICCNEITFSNACVARCDGRNVEEECTIGRCRDENPCSCNPEGGEENDPQCCNGKEFKNECDARCNGYDIDSDTECISGTCSPLCSLCGTEHDPQCCNAHIFENQCYAMCNGHDPYHCLHDYRGDTCTLKCPNVEQKLCCDGVEFQNQCFAECAVCNYLHHCTEGACQQSKPSRSNGSHGNTLWWIWVVIGIPTMFALSLFGSWKFVKWRRSSLGLSDEQRDALRIGSQSGGVNLDDDDIEEYDNMYD